MGGLIVGVTAPQGVAQELAAAPVALLLGDDPDGLQGGAGCGGVVLLEHPSDGQAASGIVGRQQFLAPLGEPRAGCAPTLAGADTAALVRSSVR